MSITAIPRAMEFVAPSPLRRWLRELPLLPLLILVPFVLAATFAPFIAPYDPTEPISGAKMFEPPFWMDGGSTTALLGTDFQDRKSTRLNSSHLGISYAVFCLKKKNKNNN